MFKLEVHDFAYKLTWISQILYDNLRMLLITRLFEVSETSCILVFLEITPTGSHFPNLVFIFVLAAILVPITGAPKLINSDLFLEKRATVPIKTQGVQRSSSGKMSTF